MLYHSYGRLSILRNLIFPPPYTKTLNKLDYLHCCVYTRHKGIIIQLVRPTKNLKAQNFFLRRTCSFNCSINRKSVYCIIYTSFLILLAESSLEAVVCKSWTRRSISVKLGLLRSQSLIIPHWFKFLRSCFLSFTQAL